MRLPTIYKNILTDLNKWLAILLIFVVVTAKGNERNVPRSDNNPYCFDTILVCGGVKIIIPVRE